MVLTRTAKSCRSDAPIVGVKSAIRSAGDGVKKRGHRGEREVSRKTIARGMPGRSGVTVVTNSHAFLFCVRGCGRIARPAFPAPSEFLGRKVLAKPRAHRAARSRSVVLKIGATSLRGAQATITVIASQRVGAKRRPMRGYAKIPWGVDSDQV